MSFHDPTVNHVYPASQFRVSAMLPFSDCRDVLNRGVRFALMWLAVCNGFCVNVAPGSEWGHAHACDKLLVSLQATQCVVKLQCDIQVMPAPDLSTADIAVRTAITLLCAYRQTAGQYDSILFVMGT